MRLFRIVGLSVLSVVLCLFLAWGAMVIVHAGEEKASGIEGFPAAAGAPAAEDAASDPVPPGESAVPPGFNFEDAFNVEDAKSIDFEAVPEVVGGVRRQVPRARAVGSDPLKDVADLGKATANQLQGGDRFLESETRRLAEQYAKAEDAEARDKLKGELAKTIEKHFDVRHQDRKREIDQLEARVRKLREHLQKRERARQAIVEMRLGQFISAAEGLGWDTDFGRTRSAYGPPGLRPLPSGPSSNKPGPRVQPAAPAP